MVIETSELTAVVEQQMRDWTVPGMAVGILKDGQIETYGFGVASIETGFPIRPDSLFQIGSISKVFTAMLAMTLVEEGKLDLDMPIVQYVPDLSLQDGDAQQSLTMRHLLTHTSGLFGDWFDGVFGMGDDALGKAMANLGALRQIAPVGEVWSYCNSGFYIAGGVIERLTGQTFEQAMKERVLRPIGMENATFFAHEAIVHPVAVGHNLSDDDEQAIARRYPLPRYVNAAGGIIADAGEMLRFASVHMNEGVIDGNRILSPDSVAEMQREQAQSAVLADHYGLGWALRNRGGARLVGHGGSTNGFRAYLTLVPKQQFAIVMLTNGSRGNAAYQRVESWALEHICGIPDERPETISLARDQLEQLAGRYEQALHKITISVDDDRLRLDVIDRSALADEHKETPQAPKYARPISDRAFVIEGGPDDGTQVDFILDDAGKPKYFRYHGRVSEPVTD